MVPFFGGCTASFGPGYSIDKQSVDVLFQPGPPPHISIQSNYEVTNTGTRPLSAIELRLPGRRRFKTANLEIKWDGELLPSIRSPEFTRNTLLNLPRGWAISDHHSLHISMDLLTPSEGESLLSFASDAFFLPAQGWAPQLLPTRGLFGKGGTPPPKWNLTVHAPMEFVVHTSGNAIKSSKQGDQQTVRATQRIIDIYPYVIAGRYVTKQIGSDRQKIYLWTRKAEDTGNLRQVSDSLIKTLDNYNAVFGERTTAQVPGGFLSRHHGPDVKHAPPLWLVECPSVSGCFSDSDIGNARMFRNDTGQESGEMISLDTAVIDPGASAKNMLSAAGPALAATWLGYGQSPGFYEQDPPLSAFPAFAAAVGSETLNGPAARIETIRRALAVIPRDDSSTVEDDAAIRAKSFLFFYALRDRYGDAIFRKAVRHMLDAERNRGFNLYDLIAAFDQESHGNTAEFVRQWMKHPGVPAEFRTKYENASADKDVSSKEITP